MESKGSKVDKSTNNKPKSAKIRKVANIVAPWFYNMFADIGISFVKIRDCKGVHTPEHIKGWRIVLFCLLRLNLAVKVAYLFYLLGWNESVDFLISLGIGIWLALAFVTVYSDYYFAQIYPAFEVFCAFWNIQTDIAEKLPNESRKEFETELNRSAKVRTLFHTFATSWAMIGLGAQYVMDPKGIAFTGSLVEIDSFLVTFLLGVHEQICLISVWYQAVAIILIPVLAGSELTICLRFLKQELDRMPLQSTSVIQQGKLHDAKEQVAELAIKKLSKKPSTVETNLFMRKELDQLQVHSTPVNQGDKTGPDDTEAKATEFTFKKSSNGEQNPYRIEDILFYYQCLQLVTDRLQYISGFILLITQIIYFSIITTDVFVAIQLWRIGDTLSVAFYAFDCSSGMLYWFYSLYSIGRLDNEMGDFGNALIYYFKREYKKRGLHLKVLKSFREINVYLGPDPILSGTSGSVIYDLMGYYILAAMW